jgi:hypothetical protein
MTKKTELEKVSESELLAELARRRASKALDLSAAEEEVEKALEEVGSRAMALHLAGLAAAEGKSAKPCPKCGKSVRVKARRPRTIRLVRGEHTFSRNYHYCGQCKIGFCPLDLSLGIPEDGELSAEMERRLLDFVLTGTFESCGERWALHYCSDVSSHLSRMVMLRVGTALAKAHPANVHEELLPRPAERPDLLVIGADGSMLQMRGKQRWKEAKVGVIRRTEKPEQESEPPKVKTRYLGTTGKLSVFKSELKVAVSLEKELEPKKMVWIADGSPWIWNLADELCPEAIQILDWSHAVQNISVCGRIIFGDTSPWLAEWDACSHRLLSQGKVTELILQLKACRNDFPKHTKALSDSIRYFSTHAKRMDYPRYRAEGLPLGSGMVESAHKHVLQARMKQAGQLWGPMGALHMARLRAAYRTAGPQKVHRAIRSAQARRVSARQPPVSASN